VCVGLWLTDYLQYLPFAGVVFRQRHCRPEFDRSAGKLRHVDHFGTGELVFQLGDPVFIYFLICLSSLIFLILGKVRIVGNCFLNALNEMRSLDLNPMPQLFFKNQVPCSGHGKLIH
jgi:hypothetical protein